MKKSPIYFFKAFALLLVFSIMLWGCKDDDPNPLAQRINNLAGTWTVQSVTNDGTDVTNQFNGFQLAFTIEKTYTTTNGGNPWPASGTFDIQEDALDTIVRDGNTNITIVSISDSSMSLRFQVNGIRSIANLRSGITGSFTFSLTKTN
ncbi:hypothetical protein BFP97_06990 [Roseivirga sp. 4D4]|uniref:lipocalin family protein n=1 Tax=Roseivirga sp. 4D4 TaxID=1889784 RepID=UPI000852EA48|nr:lipocalin family protein [Roseivirga sp. 4D4]OEK01272.1 hypothetical protein BFP97_06990 [Roseivirga sp. 4D4]